MCGSGTMVGPYHVITAGHDIKPPETAFVEHKITSSRPVSVRFSLARNMNLSPFPVEVRNYMVHPRWFSEESPHYDYATLKLEEPVGDISGHASLQSFDDQDLLSSVVNITGYPVDRARTPPLMFTMGGSIEKTTPHRLY